MKLPPPHPDLDINEDRSGQIIASILAPAILAVIAVILRVWARYVSQAAFKWDDYLIVVALVRLETHDFSHAVKTINLAI